MLCWLYFGFHLIWGQRGYIKYSALENVFQIKVQEFGEIRAKRVLLENKTSLLHRNSLDIDALDEYARKSLGLAKANEFVIPIKSQKH
jgi:hypothetical protein